MRKPLLLLTPLLAAMLLPAAPARADNGPELWYQFENRVSWPDTGNRWTPKSFKIVTVNFWGARFPGLGQALVRLGPTWELTPYLSLGFNVVPGMEQNNGVFNQQFRLEAEPALHWEGGGLAFNNRSRLERRWAQQGNLWRVRNQMRVSLIGLNWDWTPYLSNELFYDLTHQAFNQDRALVGFSHPLAEGIRLDVSYLLRFRLTDTGWDRDHALSLTYSVNHKLGSPAATP